MLVSLIVSPPTLGLHCLTAKMLRLKVAQIKLVLVACLALHLTASAIASAPGFFDKNTFQIRDRQAGTTRNFPRRRPPLNLAPDGSSSRISGGYDAPEVITSRLAFVRIKFSDGSGSACTGSILNFYLILCAAHCFKKGRGEIHVAGGWVSIGSRSGKGIRYPFYYVELYRDFHHATFQNDIALVWASEGMMRPFNTISLPDPNSTVRVGSTVYAAGFGRTSASGNASKKALETQLKVQKYKVCKRRFPDSSSKNWSPKRVLCAADRRFPRRGRAGACEGDSGGPLYQKNASEILQVGIVSFGIDCDRKGGFALYTNLTTYVSSILEYLEGNYTNWVTVYDPDTMNDKESYIM